MSSLGLSCRTRAAGLIAAALVSLPAFAVEGQWKYTAGMDFSSGDYGTNQADTDILFLPVSAAFSRDLWTYKASAALLRMDGPGNVVGGGDGGVVVGGGSQRTATETGFGDIWIGATREMPEVPSDLFYLDLGAKMKIPTADEDKGLGTGEVDYNFSADIYKPFGELTPFANLTYKVKGDPAGLHLYNVFAWSVGSDLRLDKINNVGVSLDFQEAATRSASDALELFGYFNHKLTDQHSVMFYGYTGLDDGSPDYGFGIQLSYKQ